MPSPALSTRLGMPTWPSQVTPRDRLRELLAPQAKPKVKETKGWLQSKAAPVTAIKGERQAQRGVGRQGGGSASSSDERGSEEGGEQDGPGTMAWMEGGG